MRIWSIRQASCSRAFARSLVEVLSRMRVPLNSLSICQIPPRLVRPVVLWFRMAGSFQTNRRLGQSWIRVEGHNISQLGIREDRMSKRTGLVEDVMELAVRPPGAVS